MYAGNAADGITGIVPAAGLFRQLTGDVRICRRIVRSEGALMAA